MENVLWWFLSWNNSTWSLWGVICRRPLKQIAAGVLPISATNQILLPIGFAHAHDDGTTLLSIGVKYTYCTAEISKRSYNTVSKYFPHILSVHGASSGVKNMIL